jgi:hypothetical protein
MAKAQQEIIESEGEHFKRYMRNEVDQNEEYLQVIN